MHEPRPPGYRDGGLASVLTSTTKDGGGVCGWLRASLGPHLRSCVLFEVETEGRQASLVLCTVRPLSTVNLAGK